ncbi:hypothetical protein B0H13DRAFT_1915782 [Mycena leptocephala]|nr:hypothetical protein B0H13DRAFT_1915782 [Mycena leptocephala]
MYRMDSIRVHGLWVPIGLVGDVKTSLIPVANGIAPAAHGECLGVHYKWEVGSLVKSYPFVIHDPMSRHQPYTLLSADFIESIIRVRSRECSGFVSTTGRCCDACNGLDSAVDIVEKWSRQSFSKKSIDRLNHIQLEAKLKALSRQLKAEQVKKNNYWISLKAARKRVENHIRLIDLLSVNDVPGLSRLLSTAKKEGWSTAKTAEQSQLAINGKYHPRKYTEFDRDLAILMDEIGVEAALYARNKAPIMLPSRFTISETRRELNLRITVGDVKVSDILANIETLFSDIDCEDTDEIGGLCEHATPRLKTFKMGDDLTCAEEAVTAVRAGDIHVGKEFSVAAIARHAPDDYGAKPVLLMLTCKKGSWQSAAEILQKLVQAWKLSPFGEAKHGPLKDIASDGDERRRAALYLFLSDLPGLNLYTGEDGITICFDPQHLFRCILVNGVVINKTLIPQWLEKIPGHDWSDESIHALLHPKDPQDLGRAIKLLCLVAELRDLDTSNSTPSEKNTHRALTLLGEMSDRTDDYRLGGLIPSPDKISKPVDKCLGQSPDKRTRPMKRSMDDMILNNGEEDKQPALHWDTTEWILEIGICTYNLNLSKAVASLNTVQRMGKANIHILELPEDDCIED